MTTPTPPPFIPKAIHDQIVAADEAARERIDARAARLDDPRTLSEPVTFPVVVDIPTPYGEQILEPITVPLSADLGTVDLDVVTPPSTYRQTVYESPDLRHQFQEYTDANGTPPGDCWRACLASLLEIPLADVPHFIHLYPVPTEPPFSTVLGPRWWLESIAWVEQQRPGWTLRAFDPAPTAFPFYGDLAEGHPSRIIATGQSPRGDWLHSVLVNAGTAELLHDPHPEGGGIGEPWSDIVALVREEWL